MMNSEHQQVRGWLEKLLGGPEQVPTYEVREESLSALYALMKHQERLKEIEMTLSRVRKRQTEEYRAEAERINKGLAKMCLAQHQLSGPADVLVGALAEVAQTLDVDRPDDVSLSVALGLLLEKSADISRRDLSRSEGKRLRQREQLEITEKMGQARQQLEKEEKEAESRKGQEGITKKKANFMREKQRDYARTISKHEQSLSRAGMKSELRHERLLEVAAELRKIEGEVSPLKSKLEGFREVPPDLNLAKLKVAEAEAMLEELTSRLTVQIDMLHI